MVEVVVSVAAKVAEYLVDPVVRPIWYLLNYKSNYKNLKTEVDKLKDARERVQHAVNDAKRKGEEIEGDVKKWLISANKTFDEAKKVFEYEDQGNNWWFMWLCLNLMAQYQFSKKSVRLVEAIYKLLEGGKFDRVSFKPNSLEIWPPITGYEVFESRMSTLKDVLNALINPDVNIIGVYGMGGVGKTMLAKHVARQAKKTKLFDEVVYVVVTQALDVKRIQGEIADELGLEFSEENENGRARKLSARLKSEKKVLVVLDNIWRRLDLDAVGIPFGEAHKGCKILLTSRSLDVLSNEMDSQINFLVRVLNDEEAWLLFKKMAGDSIENNDLRSVAMDVVKVCAGLPIAIVTIARALRNKSVSEWKDALLKLKIPSPENFEGMNAVACSTIELSYNRLEGEELKSTFLLCSLMGYNYSALITDLVKYGMGLGLYRRINTMQEAQDRVYTLVCKLKAACLLLDSSTSEKFAMHDVVRDVAISIASRDRHMSAVRNMVLPKDWLVRNVPNNCTALSLRSNDISELPEELECPDLQVFYIYSKDYSLRIPDNFFKGMTKLRVLDLTKLHILLLPSSLRLLVNLRTLCLDRCTLRDLSVIGNLKKLEILSFLRSHFEQLPKEISQLTELRLLDLSGCSKLKVIPPNVISSLSQLEVLYMGNSFVQWEVEGCSNERCNASLNELKHLSNLSTLDIHIHDAKILPKGLFSEKLKRYRIFIGDEWDWPGRYETSRTLKLKLKTSIFHEDNIISQLHGVEDLYLDELQGVENVLYELDGEGFPQLKHLHAQNNPYFRCIVESGQWVPHDAFPLLESIFLHNLINMEKICRGQLTAASFCKLRIIKVEYCSKLENIFSFSNARGLPQLETIEVNECSNMKEIFAIENNDEIGINEVIEFSQLRSLTLKSLSWLSNFCCEVKSSNVPTSKDDISLALFSGKVAFPNLEVLELVAINFKKMWPNQLPAGYSCIQNLTRLIIWGCGSVKYLFSSSTIGNFEQVQYLEICNCSVLEEIIFLDELKGEDRKDVIFPRLNYIKVKDHQNLTQSYSGDYIDFPSLKQPQIEQCPALKVFLSENITIDMTTSNEENMRSVEFHQDGIEPFFNGKVVFPCLEEIVISHVDNLEMIWNDEVGEFSFCKLKLVKVECCKKLQTLFTSNLLGRFASLKSLIVSDCGLLEEIFQMQELKFEGQNGVSEKVAQIKTLKLSSLSDLKYLWRQDSIPELILQDLEILTMSCCENLINLIPSSATLQNLTTLDISSCEGLINLVTLFTAKSLVRLEQLSVYGCKTMTEVVANEGEATEDEIIFRKLKRLSLDNLSSLTSFCSGNYSLKFPSLEEFILRECPKMNTFSKGVLSTPRLRKVQLNLEVDKECWKGDLNTTIQQLTGRSCTTAQASNTEHGGF